MKIYKDEKFNPAGDNKKDIPRTAWSLTMATYVFSCITFLLFIGTIIIAIKETYSSKASSTEFKKTFSIFLYIAMAINVSLVLATLIDYLSDNEIEDALKFGKTAGVQRTKDKIIGAIALIAIGFILLCGKFIYEIITRNRILRQPPSQEDYRLISDLKRQRNSLYTGLEKANQDKNRIVKENPNISPSGVKSLISRGVRSPGNYFNSLWREDPEVVNKRIKGFWSPQEIQ